MSPDDAHTYAEGIIGHQLESATDLTHGADWFAAIDNALKMLKPGGRIGVVDFYVGRKYPPEGLRRQRWLARTLWQPWFATDNVFPSPDHLPYLRNRFEQEFLQDLKRSLPINDEVYEQLD